MSQPSIAGTEALSRHTASAPRDGRPRRRWRPRSAGRGARSLCLALGLVCAAAAATSAQQAQTVESVPPVDCNGSPHTLRLVGVEVPLKTESARALGVILTTENAAEGKVFFLYWTNAQSPSPAYRDNTDGRLGSAWRPYGTGKTRPGEGVATSFFSEAKCQSEQVKKLTEVLDAPRDIPADFEEVVRVLEERGVGVTPGQVEEVSAEGLNLPAAARSDTDFYTVTREYAKRVLGSTRPHADPGQFKLSWESERKGLLDQIVALAGQLAVLNQEKNLLFGGAPRWLVIAFFTTSAVTLAVIGFVGWSAYQPVRKLRGGERPEGAGTRPEPGTDADTDGKASGEQAPQISDGLVTIISGARKRHREIRERYAPAFQTVGGSRPQEGDEDDLAGKILGRLKRFLYQRDYGDAKNIIKAELRKVRRAASTCEQLAGELDAAYTEVQEQLEAWRKNPSEDGDETPANVATPSQVPALAAVVRSMFDTLDRVAKDVAEVKGSVGGCDDKLGALAQLVTSVEVVKERVGGFDQKLAEYFKASRVLQLIGTRWYGSDYSGGRADELMREVGEAIDLYQLLSKRCSHQGASVAQTKDCLLNTLDTLKSIGGTYLQDTLGEAALPHQIAARVKLKLSDDATRTAEQRRIEELLRKHFGWETNAAEAVAKLIGERSAAREKLGKYHPGLELTQAVDAVVATCDAVKKEVRRALPDNDEALPEAVASLATGYLKLKPAAERTGALEAEVGQLREQLDAASAESAAGRELAGEVARQLNFKASSTAEDPRPVAGTLDLLKKEKEESIYLQLRLGLSSALMALEKATGDGIPDERREVADALLLENVKRGIRELLAGMEDYSGEQLWNTGIFLGFDEKWLHYLIRADLLLRTYYADRKEFGPLRKAVALACSSLLAALYEFQVEVVEVGLFEELPGDMETAPVYPGVRNLPAVREKVRAKIQSATLKEVVIDVTSFPYLVKGVQANRGCASLANPSAWVQH